MKSFFCLVKRNVTLFFKDKGMLLPSLITPIILLVLYVTFLGKVYKDGFLSNLPENMDVNALGDLVDGVVGGQLISSLLAVSTVTVAFCSNLIMVQDKFTGARKDMLVTPVSKNTISLAYYFGTLINTLVISLIATAAGLIYLGIVGFYLNVGDVFLLILDVFLVAMFGTILSSIVNTFLSTQGQMSAVGTIVSAGYGFICGAYMPISNFSDGLKNFFSMLPGTYGTSLIRNHCLEGCFRKMDELGLPSEAIEGIKKSVDCRISFFGNDVPVYMMYLILIGSILLLMGIYVFINLRRRKVD